MGATVSNTANGYSGNGQGPERPDVVPGAAGEPDEETKTEAIATASRFFAALGAQDHRALWEEFSEDARAYVINLALERGLDFDFASRLREGTAGDEEFDEYARDLVAGLRADVGNLDFDQLTYEVALEPSEPDKLRVTYLVVMKGTIGDVPSAIPAGSLVLSHDGTRWRVERLIPKPGS
jgi:hypothetical protein